MASYYRRYIPYAVFFFTVLVGAVTMLTAFQLQKPPEEEPVVSVPSLAQEGFGNIITGSPGDCLPSDGYWPPDVEPDNLCASSYFINSACIFDGSSPQPPDAGTPFAQYKLSEVKLVDENGDKKYEFSFEARALKSDTEKVKIKAYFDTGSTEGACNAVNVGGVQTQDIEIIVGETKSVRFDIPGEIQWCGCFSIDTDLLTITNTEGNTIGCGGGSGLGDQQNGPYVIGSGGICAEPPPPPEQCPISPEGSAGYFESSTWVGNPGTSNTINLTWLSDIQGETSFELHLISDGTQGNPTEGRYFLMGEGNPLMIWNQPNVSSYTWQIPDVNDLNGSNLQDRDYYRFLLRVLYDGSGSVSTPCSAQAAGGRITRPTIPPEGEPLVCNSLTASPTNGNRPLTVNFTGSGSGPAGFLYRFIYGDGASETVSAGTKSHAYTSAGTYQSQLIIVSGSDTTTPTQACTRAITVTEPPVEPETHLICQNEACIQVEGAGNDECAANADCAEEEEEEEEDTHMVCRNRACVVVSGSGDDECSRNSDCYVTTTTDTTSKPAVPETGGGLLAVYATLSVMLVAGGLAIIARSVL